MDNTAGKREELQHKTFVLMLWLLVIFGIPAASAYFVGTWLDRTYDFRPKGTIFASIIALSISWTTTIIIYKRLKKAFSELDSSGK